MAWSFQLYTARHFPPLDRVLKIVADAGYAEVEGYGGLYDDPKALRILLDRHGLTMPSAHFEVDAMERDFGAVAAIADILGVKLIVGPYIPADQQPRDAAGWQALGKRLAAIGKTANAAGYDFAWHNHDFEFAPLQDGSLPIDVLLAAAPACGLEFDVAWCVRGGHDPLPVIDRHGPRIVAVHVKDIAKAGTGADEEGWSDVGHGTIDWRGLIGALRAKSVARHYVIEHDNPSDLERFARRSMASARTY